jgi:cobalt-zinc-cadmium efflux system membrane fusion protein
MKAPLRSLCVAMLAMACAVHAAATVPEGVQRIGETGLLVPKSLQRLLGIRTALAGSGAGTHLLLAEVVADPRYSGELRAAQAGTLEAAERWVLPGEPVRKGDLLAWLRPTMAQAETARRQAEIARLDEKLRIARMNYERLRVQADALDNPAATQNNVYFEQAELDWHALQRQRELAALGLAVRQPLRAPADGTLASAGVREGELVAAGQLLFEIADPQRLQLSALSHDATLPDRLRTATLRLEGSTLPLRYRGSEPQRGGTGWKLLFEAQAPPPRPLLPGELHRIELVAAQAGQAAARRGCLALGQGQSGVWLHTAPERFVLKRGAECAAWSEGERRVVQGGVLLSQYLR